MAPGTGGDRTAPGAAAREQAERTSRSTQPKSGVPRAEGGDGDGEGAADGAAGGGRQGQGTQEGRQARGHVGGAVEVPDQLGVEVEDGRGWREVTWGRWFVDDGRTNDSRRKQLWIVDASRDEKRVARQLVEYSLAIREDLTRVKDVLDIFVRKGATQVDDLGPQLEMLRKISDTLGVLGLGALRARVEGELESLKAIVERRIPPDDTVLEGVLRSFFKARNIRRKKSEASIPPTELPPVAPKKSDGKVIRISIPALTEERRKDLVKVARKYAEEGRVSLRNVRRDGMEMLKKMEKDGQLSQDAHRTWADKIQALTDAHIADIDKALSAKEKEIMQI